MDTQLDPSTCVIARTRLKLPSGDLLKEGDSIAVLLADKKQKWCTDQWVRDALRAGHLREGSEVPAPDPEADKKAKAEAKKAEAKKKAAEKKSKAAADKKAKAEVNKKKREDQKKGSSTPKLPPPKD